MQPLLNKLLFTIIVIVVFSSFDCIGQTRFIASVSPAVIGKNETAELILMVENARESQLVSAPSLQNFTIINGPYQETGMESINGTVRRYNVYTYTIQPRRTGYFTIGAATARADGKMLQTKPVSLKVTNAATGNTTPAKDPFAGLSPFEEPAQVNTFNDFVIKKGEKAAEKIKKNIFLKVQTDKNTCFVGEPVVVTYKLYTRLKSESNIIKSPSFSGFSVIDLSATSYQNYSIEKLDGRLYNVYILRRAQLYPLQAGPAMLEMVEVENNINFIKEDFMKNNNIDDYLGGIFQPALPAEAIQAEKITLQSKPVYITVKALPAIDTTVLYNGAVGDFAIQSWVDKNTFSTDETGSLHVKISGAGNFTLLNTPEIKWPNGIEVFEPVFKDTLNRFSVPVAGNIAYHIPFTVAKAGFYYLPPIIFTFFNAGTATYKTIKTQSVTLNITSGTGKKIKINTAAINSKETIVENIFLHRWMIIVPLVLLLLAGLLIWLAIDRKMEADALKNKTNNTFNQHVKNQPLAVDKLVVNPLTVYSFKESDGLILHPDARQFYLMLNKEILVLLAGKLQLTDAVITNKIVVNNLGKAGFSSDDTMSIKNLLNDIELQLYTPFLDENRQAFYERAIQLKEKIALV